MVNVTDGAGNAIVSFDPNAKPEGWGAGRPTAMLPPTSAFAGEIGKAWVRTMDDFNSAVAAFGKSITPPPMANTFATISYMPDVANSGLMQWPGLQPEALRNIAELNAAPQMIIRARCGDVRRYAEHSAHPWKPGWRIELMDSSRSPNRNEARDIREAEQFIKNCGSDASISTAAERDGARLTSFAEFLAAGVNDLLTFDGWSVWTDRDRAGRVRAFTNLSAGNIRMAQPDKGYKNDPRLFAAIVDDTGSPICGFTREEMVWKTQNPRTKPGTFGYGWSFIEMGMRLVQGFQSAIELNVDTFDKNAIPNGIMLLMGDFWTPNQMEALIKEWGNLKKGISKTWGLPILGVPEDGDIKMLPLNDLKGTDVRYKDHMNMMAGILCLLANFPVRRLGYMASGNHRDSEPLTDQSTDLVGDDDAGLAPLLLLIEDLINPYILWTRWPHLRLVFNGKNPKEDAREYEARKQARTWGESRAEADLPPLESLADEEDKPLMNVMSLCPEDPAKMGVFQAALALHMEIKAGVAGGADSAQPGAPFPGKKDPAKAEQQHGHASGVRRNSRKEKGKAAALALELEGAA